LRRCVASDTHLYDDLIENARRSRKPDKNQLWLAKSSASRGDLHGSPKNIERLLKQLKENGFIEFRGATQTGGYDAAAAKPASPKGG
jgi:hypothetical protein